MRKGITPIISILILLLIAVGLAASAWAYISNYTTGLTGKVVEVSTQDCINGEDGLLVFHNMGTDPINVNEVLILDGDTGSEKTVTWNYVNGTGTPTIMPAGGYARATAPNCCNITAGTCPKVCKYKILVSGKSQDAMVDCQGA